MKIPHDTYDLILQSIPIVCVDLLIFYNEKCLLLLRKNEPARGQYWFPGGRIEKMETIREAAIRKAKLETNLDCQFQKIVSVEESIFPGSPSAIALHTVNVCCLVTTDNIGPLRFDNDHEGSIWVDSIPHGLHSAVNNPLMKLGFKTRQ